MKEKFLFLGMLAMSALYCIEVIPNAPFGTLNYVGFAIAAVVLIPTAVGQALSLRKWLKNRAAKKALKEKEKLEKAKKN